MISLSPNWTVYIIFYFGPCAILCVKVNFLSDIFAKLTFENFFSPRKLLYQLKKKNSQKKSEIEFFEHIKFLEDNFESFEEHLWLIQFFYKNEEVDSKAERNFTQIVTQHLCITNKQLSVHASSAEKDVTKDKDGYSIQLTEWERGNRGELFAAEPASSRAVRSSVPHLGITTAWSRSPGQQARWVSSRA